MACVGAVAGASAVTAAVTGTSAFVSRSGFSSAVYPSPLLLKRGVFGAALKGSNAFSRRAVPLKRQTVRAATSDDTADPSDIVADLKTKWDAIENKTEVVIYGGGAIVALWLSSTVVGAINSVPLLPKIMEFIGLCYSGWFIYRYLLFKSSRKELIADLEELRGKITGSVTGSDTSSTEK
ncbi:hypothetical protein R1flu_019889 [Riccia fluitans]|uniref:Cyanobacterial aminoacyl-tRNA synthetase CAAD domain-containing protein n=1 Tax=Riccia fluitans TaxID=41844 RepID=A0ABD1ZLJ9_9MARC